MKSVVSKLLFGSLPNYSGVICNVPGYTVIIRIKGSQQDWDQLYLDHNPRSVIALITHIRGFICSKSAQKPKEASFLPGRWSILSTSRWKNERLQLLSGDLIIFVDVFVCVFIYFLVPVLLVVCVFLFFRFQDFAVFLLFRFGYSGHVLLFSSISYTIAIK